MPLLNLPAELLIEIINDTRSSPRSFEALLLTCKSLYERGQEFVAHHVHLWAMYRHFRINERLSSSLLLLLEISRDPLIANHIEIADFKYDNMYILSGVQGYAVLGDYVAKLKTSRPLHQLLVDSWLLQRAGCEFEFSLENWSRYGPENIAIFTTMLIMSLLPNVQELILPLRWALFPVFRNPAELGLRGSMWRMLDTLALGTCSGTGINRSLVHLQRITYPGPMSDESETALHALSRFLALPSLIEIRVESCIAHRDCLSGDSFDWHFSTHHSRLKRIDLKTCYIDESVLAEVLTKCPQLRTLNVSYLSLRHVNCEWDAHEFVKAIEEHCADRLTSLSITVGRALGWIKGGLRSFQTFTRLENLELDVRFIHRRYCQINEFPSRKPCTSSVMVGL